MSQAEGATTPILSVVIPVYNEEPYIGATLCALRVAVDNAGLSRSIQVVIVDDGSSDRSSAEALRAWGEGIEIIKQENSGRLAARRRGLVAARAASVLSLDARVLVDEGALEYLSVQTREHPDRRLWNGDIRIRSRDNLFARFWEVLTATGWSAYHRDPRLVSFSAADFDRFPKGTGMFLAPNESWLRAYRAMETVATRLPKHLVSDDTSLLRMMLERDRAIWIGPGFSGEYRSSITSLPAFVRNALYRGGTFVDSYVTAPGLFGRTVRAFPLVVGLSSLVLVVGFVHAPLQTGIAVLGTLLIPVVGVALLAARLGDSFARSLRVGALSLPFVVGFLPGLIRAFFIRMVLASR